MRRVLILCLLNLTAGGVAADTSPVDSNPAVEIGRRIYQEGIVASGEALRGEGAAQISFAGKQAACVRCHRRSGLGTSEGTNIISPIAGGYLFPVAESGAGSAAVTPAQTVLRQRALARQGRPRAAYTQATFARALRDGVDAAGRTLDRLMPRYALDDQEVAALADYLKILSVHPDPGVDDTTIHFATVVMPGVEPRRSKAMLDVLNAYFADKNADTRSEGRRRTVGTEAMYSAYRRWKLHVWTLTGPPEEWNAQLEQQYRQQPVFALLSGIGNTSWRPLHDFCERLAIPCLFPNNDLPITDGGYYSFYFSRGMALEAEVLARHLGATPDQGGRIVQAFRKGDSQGAAAAQVLRSSLTKSGGVMDIVDWPFSGYPGVTDWQQMLADKHPSTLVLWVSGDELARLGRWDVGGYSPQRVFLSASMLGGSLAGDAGWLDKLMGTERALDSIRLIYPFALQETQHLKRTRLWLRAKNIPPAEEWVQANTYFAAMVAGDSISHMFQHFSRDYLIERVEHMVGRSLVTSVYPRLSLGPGQRFISRGAYLVKYSRSNDIEPVTDWIVP